MAELLHVYQPFTGTEIAILTVGDETFLPWDWESYTPQTLEEAKDCYWVLADPEQLKAAHETPTIATRLLGSEIID